MVEEVIDPCFEVVDLQRSTAVGNLNAELVLLIALAAKRDEAGVEGIGVGYQRPLDTNQRRSLVVAAIEAA